ncbi:MAG TPA: hypothetical protein VM389_13060, partial [Phycisphaerae bacterium]|nr:hypothetical protein [Phycisphaerae bacterium]
GCQVQPITLPDGWHDARIWQQQLSMVRELLPGGDCLVVSADADQLFERPAALPPGQSAIPFRRLEMVAEGPSRLGVFDESGRGRAYLGAFVRSVESVDVGVTGHWTGPVPSRNVPVEFHVHLRGLAAFRRKLAAIGFDPTAPAGLGHHWRDWQAIVQEEGEEGLARLYGQQTADYLFADAWPPALRGKLERLQAFLQGWPTLSAANVVDRELA